MKYFIVLFPLYNIKTGIMLENKIAHAVNTDGHEWHTWLNYRSVNHTRFHSAKLLIFEKIKASAINMILLKAVGYCIHLTQYATMLLTQN